MRSKGTEKGQEIFFTADFFRVFVGRPSDIHGVPPFQQEFGCRKSNSTQGKNEVKFLQPCAVQDRNAQPRFPKFIPIATPFAAANT